MDMKNKSFHSGELTLCPSWHELPKSTILIADLLGLHKRIFSGLRSQWIMLSSGVDRNSKAVHSCCANLRVKLRDTPRKLVLRSKSYKLYDSNSKTRHRWLRHMKCRFSFTTTQSTMSYTILKKWYINVSLLFSVSSVPSDMFQRTLCHYLHLHYKQVLCPLQGRNNEAKLLPKYNTIQHFHSL